MKRASTCVNQFVGFRFFTSYTIHKLTLHAYQTCTVKHNILTEKEHIMFIVAGTSHLLTIPAIDCFKARYTYITRKLVAYPTDIVE